MLHRLFLASAVFTVTMLNSAVAQDTRLRDPAVTTTSVDRDVDDGFDMGLAGLLGLLGLAGLMPRDRSTRTNVGTHSSTRP